MTSAVVSRPEMDISPSTSDRTLDRTVASAAVASGVFGQGYVFGGGSTMTTRTSSSSMDVEPTSLTAHHETSSTSSRATLGNLRSAPFDNGNDSDTSSKNEDDQLFPLVDTSRSSGIPSTYNLGRRTSVSAESLDPSNTPALPRTVIPKSASQRARIEASISNNLLFRNLDAEQHSDAVNAMKEVSVLAGTEVIVQGAVGDYFYVVEEGHFEVWVKPAIVHTYVGPGITTVSTSPPTSSPDSTPSSTSTATTPVVESGGREGASKVASYGPGGSFGELALMYNAPRAATVVSTSNATMWALDRVTFRSILMEHTSRKRKMYETFLATVPILESLEPKERSKIADALEEREYDEGENVVVEGEAGKNFYIIESGRAQVVKAVKDSAGKEEEVLGTLSKGDYFGELALLNSAPRAATVRAMAGEGKLRVATLGEKAFTRLLGSVLDILQRKAERSYGVPSPAATPLATTATAETTA